jgi:SH2 domain-containing protein 4A
VKFREGADGKPWVWVMGEHPDDLLYEELVRMKEAEREREEKEKVRKEAEELARHETRDILLIAPDEGTDNDALMEVATDSPTIERKLSTKNLWKKAVDSTSQLIKKMTEEERRAFEKRRADELYEKMLQNKEVSHKRAADVALEILKQWHKSEAKAKKLEMERKRQVLTAKMKLQKEGIDDVILAGITDGKKHEVTSKPSEEKPTAMPAPTIREEEAKVKQPRPEKPKTLNDAIEWFREEESPKKVGMETDGTISLWFHGAITKEMAVNLLAAKPAGTFLVRLTNKIWGYTVSVKTYTSIKHFLIDTESNVYKFIGKHQPEFASLSNLLSYYRVNPVTWIGQEILLLPCQQPSEQLAETTILFDEDYAVTFL